jgi:hypothetical protein
LLTGLPGALVPGPSTSFISAPAAGDPLTAETIIAKAAKMQKRRIGPFPYFRIGHERCAKTIRTPRWSCLHAYTAPELGAASATTLGIMNDDADTGRVQRIRYEFSITGLRFPDWNWCIACEFYTSMMCTLECFIAEGMCSKLYLEIQQRSK